MAGKIQRKNKTNKVIKKAKYARRTRRVSRKTLNKRKQRKGGDSFMSRLKGLSSGESMGILTKFEKCNMNENRIEIEDMSGNSIKGKTFNNVGGQQTKIDRICQHTVTDTDNKKKDVVVFISNKTRIEMDKFKDDYPEYEIENGKYIKYKFESENGNYKLIEDTDKDNKTSFFNRFNPFYRSK